MIKRSAVLLLALLLAAGCVGIPTPGSSQIVYAGPAEQAIGMGESFPGSNIKYVGFDENGAKVVIGDQEAVKKVGDSLDWKITSEPGVEIILAQRVLQANAQRLQTVGTVKLTVSGVRAEAAQVPADLPFSYKVAVTYTVKRGEFIPGTLITYAGKNDSGAQLGGVSGYPYRRLGDSIAWSGRLRSNVYLDTTLRVIAYTDEGMQVGGLATIGLAR